MKPRKKNFQRPWWMTHDQKEPWGDVWSDRIWPEYTMQGELVDEGADCYDYDTDETPN
jgi:hypothetical protein